MSDEAYARYRSEIDEILASREAMGMPVYFGSNAWVAAPKKSKTGNPLLYGGPMMGFTTPSICSEVHLVAEGLNVAGMSFPGAPGVMIGWNERLAWTTASGGADLVDIYVLDLNPDNPEEYRYNGEWRKFEILDREIKVRGGDVEKLRVYRSVYGPLVGEPDVKNLRAHSMRMSFWKSEEKTFEAVLDINVAGTVEEFIVEDRTTQFLLRDPGRPHRVLVLWRPSRPEGGHDPRFPQDARGAWSGGPPAGGEVAAEDGSGVGLFRQLEQQAHRGLALRGLRAGLLGEEDHRRPRGRGEAERRSLRSDRAADGLSRVPGGLLRADHPRGREGKRRRGREGGRAPREMGPHEPRGEAAPLLLDRGALHDGRTWHLVDPTCS